MAKDNERTEGGMKPDVTSGQDTKKKDSWLKEHTNDDYAQMSDSMAEAAKKADDQR